MNLILTRTQHKECGVFGELTDESGAFGAVTLEHAYPDGNGGFTAKIPDGEFKCVRGGHLLHGMTTPFETFEITGVEGHSNLLFHWGNWNKDSEGCILVGEDVVGGDMITNSRAKFAGFMDLQAGLADFILVVR